MKKILALVLTLAMMLTMLNVGFVASAAETKPEGAIAISTPEGLASMEAGKYYYLTADITLGSPQINNTDDFGNAITDDVMEMAEEADRITIPAGATLDGNGYTIYQGFYNVDNGWYAENNKYTHSQSWTHEMFVLEAGAQITIKNLKIGDQTLPVYLSNSNAAAGGSTPTGYTVNDGFGIFADTTGADVVWNNVSFTVERYGRGLGSYNFGPVMFSSNGTHAFTDCTMNVSIMSAGSQYGGWFYYTNGATSFTNCVNNGFEIYVGTETTENPDGGDPIVKDLYEGNAFWGSVGGGFIHTAKASTTMIGCVNNVNISATYSGTGYKFGGFIGEQQKGDVYVENCVNYGNFTLNKITIGGGIVGRTSGVTNKFQVLNCINYGNIKRTSSEGMTENHGFGGITGHTNAIEVYEVIGCVNYGYIQGVGNIGGVVGFVEGAAPVKVIENCANYGKITSVGNVEAGGIIGQARTTVNVTNCKNYGDMDAAALNGGIAGQACNSPATLTITNCENYGNIGTTSRTHAAGIIAKTSASNNATVTLNNCVNYGKITTKQYSGGMMAEAANVSSTIVMTGCKNFGEIAGVHGVGGFIGHTNNSENINITIEKSLNAGDVHQSSVGGEGIGGFLGRIAGYKTVITIKTSVNTGVITGSTKNSNQYGAFGDCFGQFIGCYTVGLKNHGYTGTDIENAAIVGGFLNWDDAAATKITMTYCFAYGKTVVADGAMSLKGWITATDNGDGTVTDLAQANCIASTIPVTEAPNDGLFGVNVAVKSTASVYTEAKLAVSNAITQIQNRVGLTMMAGAEDETALVVATPALRGYQMSTDGADLRVLATVSSKNYEEVGFTYSVTIDETPVLVNQTATCGYVMESINARGEDDAIESKTAAELGGKYISAITFVNVPATGTVVITVAPNAGAYTGAAYTMTIVDGVVTAVAAA